MISQPAAFYSTNSWLYHHQQQGFYHQNQSVEVSSKTGAPLKQYAAPSNVAAMNTAVALRQGVPLTRPGGLIIAPGVGQSPMEVAQLAAASQLLAVTGQEGENGKPKNKNYKTELCRPFQETGECKYKEKCQFAHGRSELRNIPRHPKFKTEPCKNFHERGYCPYGTRCHFIHYEDPKQVVPTAPVGIPGFCAPHYSTPSTEQGFEHSPTQDLSIQAHFTTNSLGSAGESPIPSSTGSQSPHSLSPGLTSGEDDPFSVPPTFPMDPKSQRFVFPSPEGKVSLSSDPDVDFLAAGLDDMFGRNYSLEELTAGPKNGDRRLSVFTRLSSSN